MITLSVFCRTCGQRIEKDVDEHAMPEAFRCSCGEECRLAAEDGVDGEDAMAEVPDGR